MGTVIKNSSHKTKTGLISNKDLAKRTSGGGSASSKDVQAIDAAAKKAGTFDSPQTYGTTVGAPEGYAYNPVTGKNEKLAGVGANYNPLTSGAGPDSMGPASYANTAIQSTQGIRNQEGATKFDASSLLGLINATNGDMDSVLQSYLGMGSYGDTKEGKKQEDRLSDIFDSITKITPDQQAGIDAEAAATRQSFDEQIATAESNKAQGMAKNIIGAGERGGFMNTQFAGVGAVLPTEGETFVGTGGELNRLKSEYDAQISNLQSQRIIAVNKAIAAAKEAAITGNRQLFNDAVSYYNLAKSSYDDTVSTLEKKINLVNTFQQQQRNDAQQNLQYMLNTFGAGAFDDNIDALKQSAAAAGYDPELFAKGIKTLKEQKQLGELREVGGSLYNITYDKSGNPVAKLIVAKPGGSGSGSGSKSGQFTQDELMASDIQNYADRVESGQITLSGVPTGTTKTQTRAKVMQVLSQREDMRNSGYGDSLPKSNVAGGKFDLNTSKANVNKYFSGVAGSDGKVSPDDYKKAKAEWGNDGGSPSEFDKLFEGWRDATNPNYGVRRT